MKPISLSVTCIALVVGLSLSIVPGASALDLNEAKSQGLVGEKINGVNAPNSQGLVGEKHNGVNAAKQTGTAVKKKKRMKDTRVKKKNR